MHGREGSACNIQNQYHCCWWSDDVKRPRQHQPWYWPISPRKSRAPWASYQIRKIAGAHAPGMPVNVFPATAGMRSRHALRHVRDARAVMHAGITNERFPLKSAAGGKCSRHSRCMRNPQFYVSGKMSMQHQRRVFDTYRIMSWKHITNCLIYIEIMYLTIFIIDTRRPFRFHNKHLWIFNNKYPHWHVVLTTKLIISIGASIHNADGRLTARSREVSKPRDLGLDISNRS